MAPHLEPEPETTPEGNDAEMEDDPLDYGPDTESDVGLELPDPEDEAIVRALHQGSNESLSAIRQQFLLAKAVAEARERQQASAPTHQGSASGSRLAGVKEPGYFDGKGNWGDYEGLLGNYFSLTKVPESEWGLRGTSYLTPAVFRNITQAYSDKTLVPGKFSWAEFCQVMRAAAFGGPTTELGKLQDVLKLVQAPRTGGGIRRVLDELTAMFRTFKEPLNERTRISLVLLALPPQLRQRVASDPGGSGKEWSQWVPFWAYVQNQAQLHDANAPQDRGALGTQQPARMSRKFASRGSAGAGTSQSATEGAAPRMVGAKDFQAARASNTCVKCNQVYGSNAACSRCQGKKARPPPPP